MRFLRYFLVMFFLCVVIHIKAQQPQQSLQTQPSQPQPVVNPAKELPEILLSKTVVQITTFLQGSEAAVALVSVVSWICVPATTARLNSRNNAMAFGDQFL
jgi:hypothetical protein